MLDGLAPVELDLPADLLHTGSQHGHVLLQLLHAEHRAHVEMVNGAARQLAQLRRRTDVFKGTVAPVSVWL